MYAMILENKPDLLIHRDSLSPLLRMRCSASLWVSCLVCTLFMAIISSLALSSRAAGEPGVTYIKVERDGVT